MLVDNPFLFCVVTPEELVQSVFHIIAFGLKINDRKPGRVDITGYFEADFFAVDIGENRRPPVVIEFAKIQNISNFSLVAVDFLQIIKDRHYYIRIPFSDAGQRHKKLFVNYGFHGVCCFYLRLNSYFSPEMIFPGKCKLGFSLEKKLF